MLKLLCKSVSEEVEEEEREREGEENCTKKDKGAYNLVVFKMR